MRKGSRNFLIALCCSAAGIPAFAQTVVAPSASFAIPAGSLNLACTDLTVQGSAVLGSGQINQAGTVGIAAAGMVDGGQGTITVGGNWNNSGTFNPGTGTVVFSDTCGNTSAQLSGVTTFHNLTFTSTTGKPFVVPAGHNITVTGSLVLQGTPGNPLQLVSSAGPTAYIALGPNASVNYINSQVAANVQIGAAIAGPTAIPTLGQAALLLLVMLLAAMAAATQSARLHKINSTTTPTR